MAHWRLCLVLDLKYMFYHRLSLAMEIKLVSSYSIRFVFHLGKMQHPKMRIYAVYALSILLFVIPCARIFLCDYNRTIIKEMTWLEKYFGCVLYFIVPTAHPFIKCMTEYNAPSIVEWCSQFHRALDEWLWPTRGNSYSTSQLPSTVTTRSAARWIHSRLTV